MLRKAVLLIMDGLGDRPVRELDDLTPLERARTPNLDRLAADGICGLMSTLGLGRVPGSDTAHLTLLGYDIGECYFGRGPIEVAGLGLKLEPGDVALRGNLGTVDDSLTIIDRRAGRITDVSGFARELDGIEIEGVRFIVAPGTGHRVGVVMRGKGLSAQVSDADPHVGGVKPHRPVPLVDSPEARFTADVLTRFIATAHEVLSKSRLNQERVARGLPAANYVLLRGAGQYHGCPTFKDRYGLNACTIAGAGLYKGIGAYTGMTVVDVPGATGLPNTDVRAKFQKLVECLQTYDFAFVHVKAADSLGEDRNCQGKMEFIEKVDAAAEVLFGLPDDVLLVITADHSTPCELGRHSGDPVPILMRGQGVRVDSVCAFGERPCASGGLGLVQGGDVMLEILNLIGLGKLVGA